MTEAPATATEPPRPVSPFELFFDLVFVFSLTRVTSLILEHPSAVGMVQGLLVLALLWWAWGAYAWLTNAVDINSVASRAVIIGAMGAMLVVAVAVPRAFAVDALVFALGYFVVRLLHLVLFAVAGGVNRLAILRLAPGNLSASLLLIIGVFVPGNVQIALWMVAVLIDYGTPLLTGVAGFTVHAKHFFERHTLFMLIALGESIISVGLGVLHGGDRIDLTRAGAVLLALATISGLWWAYFDWEAGVTERVLSGALGPRRAHLARDLFSYLHLPLVSGIIFAAVGLEEVMTHPLDAMHAIHAVGLGAGAGAFLLGLSAVSGRRGHRPRVDHLIGGLISIALIPVATRLPGLLTLSVLVVVLLFIAFVDRTRNRVEPLTPDPAVAAPATS